MAKSNRTMYFAVKLVAATFGKQRTQGASIPDTTVTKDSTQYASLPATTVTKDRTQYASVPATTVTKDSTQYASLPATTVTKDSLSVALESESGEPSFLRIGGKPGTVFHGIAGHFTAQILDFSDKEDRKCKTLAEAEQLVKKAHKDWLADAYDWYVAPAEIGGASQFGGKRAKSAGAAKRSKK